MMVSESFQVQKKDEFVVEINRLQPSNQEEPFTKINQVSLEWRCNQNVATSHMRIDGQR